MDSPLFEPAIISGIHLRNRIIRSATHEGLVDTEGFPGERLAKRYLQLARGGVGAIITGFAGVAQSGKCHGVNMLMVDRDAHVPAYRRLVDEVHACGTPILLQIAHCGRQTRTAGSLGSSRWRRRRCATPSSPRRFRGSSPSQRSSG